MIHDIIIMIGFNFRKGPLIVQYICMVRILMDNRVTHGEQSNPSQACVGEREERVGNNYG